MAEPVDARDLKSLGPLACVGSTPTPGTSCFQRLTGQVNEGDEKPLTSMVSIWVSMNRPASRAYSRRDERGIHPAVPEFDETYAWGSRTISNDKIRFPVATEAYEPWWRQHRTRKWGRGLREGPWVDLKRQGVSVDIGRK